MNSPTVDSPWPHRVAVLLACATFPLIWLGGLVTTYDAGMAVPDWPSTFGYNLFLYPWQTWITGPWDLFIEHGHRLLASLVGFITLILAIVVWKNDPRRWVCWFSVACVFGVLFQGVLGGLRVLLNERAVAKIHGCVGPLFFCMAVGMVIVTSRRWRDAVPVKASVRTGALAWLVTFMAFAQIVVGAQLRHITVGTTHAFFRAAVFFHIAIAAALLLHVMLLISRVVKEQRESELGLRAMLRSTLLKAALFLAILVSGQVLLGISSWIVKYGPPALFGDWMVGYTVGAKTLSQSLIVTGHVATGSLILVTCLTIALNATRSKWIRESANSKMSSNLNPSNSPNASMRLEAVG